MAEGQIEDWFNVYNTQIVVQAVRLREDNVEEIAKWCRGDLVEEIDPEHPEETQYGINVETPSGIRRAHLHMYVVRHQGNFFTQHNRAFETMYRPVNRESTPLESNGDSKKARGFADPFGGSAGVHG